MKVCMVMEFCGSQTLGKKLELCETREVVGKGYFRQVLEGVRVLHDHGIYHRDLKLSNILVTTDNVIKIIDFGLSTTSDDPVTTEFCGTQLYLPPEILLNQPYHSSTADIWTLGVILFCILFNTYPFGGTPSLRSDVYSPEYKKNIVEGRILFPHTSHHVSGAAKELIIRILQKKPAQRLPLIGVLASSWFNPT